MASGFLLLPLLLMFLSEDEIGLWYVYVAVSNLVMLFEFGFSPAFARNIVYCLSGVRELKKEGAVASEGRHEEVDWHLLKTVMKATRLLYGLVSLISLVVLLTLGTFYVWWITRDAPVAWQWVAWGVFCLAMFLNLYFLYTQTFLRGFGDIAGEGKAKTFSRIIQLATSAILLALGAGIVGAAIGYLCNSIALRLFSYLIIRSHKEISLGLKGDEGRVTKQEARSVFSAVSYTAVRDGFVQLSCYAATQATSLICSLFLTLGQTGVYSILLQLGTAAYQFASVYARTLLPAFQSSCAKGEVSKEREMAAKGIVAYWILFFVGVAGLFVVVLPILMIFRPDLEIDLCFFLFLLAYLGLWGQHSLCCNFILATNSIPYVTAYVLSSLAGVALSLLFVAAFNLGVWGIVAGAFASQLACNNWRWPRHLAKSLGLSYLSLLSLGFPLILSRRSC